MSAINNSNTPVSKSSSASVGDGWDDSQHSSVMDFFHRHCPKITNDAEAIIKDAKTGLHTVADMAHQAVGAGEDIVDTIRNDGGLKNAMKNAIHDLEDGKNPLKGVISKSHVDALKSDAMKLKGNVEKLIKDGKPVGEDILNGMVQAKNAAGSVMDIVKIAGEIYSGQVPPGTLQSLEADAKNIFGDLGKAIQWQSSAAH